MYKINCVICHGEIGNGQGELLGYHVYKERKICSELTQEDLWKKDVNYRAFLYSCWKITNISKKLLRIAF